MALIPLKDDNPHSRTLFQYDTVALISACVAVMLVVPFRHTSELVLNTWHLPNNHWPSVGMFQRAADGDKAVATNKNII